MVEDLEQRVSSALHELAGEPVALRPLFDRVASQVRRQRRQRLLGGTVAVVALTALAAGPVMPRGGGYEPGAGPACPDRDTGTVTDRGHAGLADRLVPGRPDVATVCRYRGLNESESAPVRAAVVRGDDLAALVVALNAGQRIPKGGVYHCPAQHLGTIRAIFAYRDGSVVTVHIDESGCRFASNGSLMAHTTPSAQQRLADLVGIGPG